MLERFTPQVIESYDLMAREVMGILSQPTAMGVLDGKLASVREQRATLPQVETRLEPVNSRTARELVKPVVEIVHKMGITEVRPSLRVYAASDAFDQVCKDVLGRTLPIPAFQGERLKPLISATVGTEAGGLFGRVVDLGLIHHPDSHMASTSQILGHDLSVIYLSRPQYDLPSLFCVLAHEYVHALQLSSGHWYFKSDDETLDNGNQILREGDALAQESRFAQQFVNGASGPEIVSAHLKRHENFISGALQLINVFTLLEAGQLAFGINPLVFSPHALGAALFAVAEAICGPEIHKRIHRGDLGFLEELAKAV
ncbi:MAG: hypothetical protein HQM16_18870 [Deltaproteobacteria bacterium]|nr:hypothetical protein [Deltaproteobacteria bacterium]